eukprot:38824-Eustigmatos_ZCMA.PRE.1
MEAAARCPSRDGIGQPFMIVCCRHLLPQLQSVLAVLAVNIHHREVRLVATDQAQHRVRRVPLKPGQRQ